MNAPVQQSSLAAPNIEEDPYFRHLIGQTHKSDAMRDELVACCSAWVKRQLEQQRRLAPAVGLTNERIIGIGHRHGLSDEDGKMLAFARGVLGAATHATGPAPAPPVSHSAQRKIDTLSIEARQLQEKAEAWRASSVPMLETLNHLSTAAPDEATRQEARAAIAAAFPKKDTPWTS